MSVKPDSDTQRLCPLINRNVISMTDEGIVSATKLHPCIEADCALWVSGEPRYSNEAGYYEAGSHCGLREVK